MRFILIMSTLGRVNEIDRFCRNLAAQTHQNFRLCVCDQNTDDRLDHLIAKHSETMHIDVVRSAKGLSKGRNAALCHMLRPDDPDFLDDQTIIAFPDDDCWYDDPRLLEDVAITFAADETLDGLTVRSVDEAGKPSASNAPKSPLQLGRQNIFVGNVGISYCIFLRRHLVQTVGEFDEALGVGAGTPWGAGEESDYLIRALHLGYRLRHRPDIHVSHPRKNERPDKQRYYAYAMGHGRVLRKNGYSPLFLIKDTGKALAAFIVKSTLRRTILTPYLWRARGYVQGFLSS